MILESKNNHNFDCGIVFVARSNVRIRNMTGNTLGVRIDTADSEYDENVIHLENFEVNYLPLPLINEKELKLALHNSDGSWTKSIPFVDLVQCEGGRFISGGYLLYVESQKYCGNKDKLEIYDHFVEIVSGIRLVNALPYRVEVRYSQEKDSDQSWIKMGSHPLSSKSCRVAVECGEETLIPVSLNRLEDLKLSFRLGSFTKNNDFNVKFSESIHFLNFFDKDSPNITTEDVNVHLFNKEGSHSFKRPIRVRKIRDSSKDSLHSRYLSTPTVELISDLWIQNNSGIPLVYRLKDVRGKQLETNDCECGHNELSVDFTSDKKLENGPVLGFLDGEKFQLRLDTEREIVANDITLHKWGNIKTKVNLPSSFNSGIFKNTSWSKTISISSNSIVAGEVECDGIWLGVSIERGSGVFSHALIAVITPRYVLLNKTSLDLDFFPVRLWKRIRKSSTDSETQGMI